VTFSPLLVNYHLFRGAFKGLTIVTETVFEA